ncbi:MAG: chloride channel protein [Kiritimatiellae bacterium]|nr:chloride channel protein [Kiritimatiellia bacterium]
MAWFSISKLLFAGSGLSFRTGKYFGLATIAGTFAGVVVVAFRHLIDLGNKWLFEGVGGGDRWVMAFLPAVGALLGYMLIRRFDSLEHIRGTDSAILAFHRRHGYVPPAVLPVKSVASVLTVASGGSAGYEGPVTLIGAACGSIVASWFGLSRRARRILMTAGISAGIAALFQAPLAGAIFGFEVLYSSSDIEYDCILPCFAASTISYTIYAYFFGWGALFPMPGDIAFQNGLRLFPYFVLAVVVAFGARLYISVFGGVANRFSALRMPGEAKVVLGGLLTGAVGLLVPETLGTSYPVIQKTLSSHSAGLLWLLAIFFAKVVATSFTVGSGGSGGVFAPAIVCGGTLGGAVGVFFARVLPLSWGVHPAAFALVGMAGFLASAIRTPLTAIIMVAEISGNHQLIVPAMWVCGIAFWLNNGWTLYRSQPHNRESSMIHQAERRTA